MKTNELEDFLIRQVKKENTPSIQYRIFNKDHDLFSFQYGYSDILNKKEITGNTGFHAYSVTKTFTALAILQLAEQKKLNIEDPALSCLPDFPYSPEISIRQLMNHSAGIPNPVPLSWIHAAEEHDRFDSRQFFRQVFRKYPKTSFRPGEKFAYSNLGYVLLGQIIEQVSGLSYEDYITENIMRMLDLSNRELGFRTDEIEQTAKGYHKNMSFSNLLLGFFIDKEKYMGAKEGPWRAFRDHYVNGAAYGGLIGTSAAFVKYIRELLRPGCRLIGDDYKKLLFTENRNNRNQATGMCLSWFTGKLNDRSYCAHAGGGGGYYCEIRIYPEQGIGSVLAFNRTGMRDERFLDKTDRYFTGEFL
ncbi:MAG: beta-lactamase family protein [Bacteroidia bacterium]|nr:beta-lactamase family protein [Bacteroidia bacterium]